MSAAAPILAPRGRSEVQRPTLGVFLDRTPEQVPDRGLQDCLNVRIKNGQIRNENMGWETFPPGGDPINLDGEQGLLIAQFFQRSGAAFLLFGTRYDLYRYDEGALEVRYITPTYNAGQITAAVYAAGPDETTITGSGTQWATDPGDRNGGDNAIANDMLHIGADDEDDPGAAWFRVKQVNSDTELVVDGDATAGFPGTFDYTLRQRFTGDNLDLWRDEIFPAYDTGSGLEDRWYATNGVDNVVRWRGTTLDPNGATRVNLGFTCRVLRRTKNIMLYANLEESGEAKPQSIRSSDVGDPEDVTNGLASEFVPSDGVDPIVDLLPIGDVVAVYNQRSINTIEFVGDPFIFVSRTAVSGLGPIAAGAIVDFGDFHEFLAADSAYEFNGVGVEEIGSQVFREVLRTISPNRQDKILTHIDEENGEVQWIIPRTTDGSGSDGGPRQAFTAHYLEEVAEQDYVPFTIRELPATATGFFERAATLTWDLVLTEWRNTNFRWNDKFFEAAFPFNLFADESGFIYVLGTSDAQHDGAQQLPIRSFIRTPRRAAIDGDRVGVAQKVEPYAPRRASADYDLTVRLYGADRLHGDVSLLEEGAYDLTHAGERFVPFRSGARFVELEFETNGIIRPFELDGWAVTVVAAGSR